ncbi:vWA domain-containing protein [Litoribacillus peritrichatus]|uniref:VWFA domain-containing protein n=1 Tax=Litoribacillus peritrichatus TaxID=718191 RepID=A0ABP7MBS4_9GAMM
MKTKLTAIALFTVTAVTVIFYPMLKSMTVNAQPTAPVTSNPVIDAPATLTNERPKIEVVFVLDTTGSMSGLIDAAKEKIWSIASSMASAQPAPEIKMGLVAYRDRGDAYVTQVIDLSSDLDTMFATLMDFSADGGGDGPESVNKALYDAVHGISWSQDSNSYKAVFLVGDAPPHMDYQDEQQFPEILNTAKTKDIVVNTIQCGQDNTTKQQWQQIAQLAKGSYFQVEQAGSAIAIETPFDDEIASLSKELDDTRLYYGTKEQKAKQSKKVEATNKLHDKSSVASRARRATYNSSKSGESNFLGEGELVEDFASGRIDLSTIDQDQLPEPMQALAPEEQKAEILGKAEKRKELKARINELAQQRQGFLKDKADKMENAEESLDYKLFGTISEQAQEKGISYKSAAPSL